MPSSRSQAHQPSYASGSSSRSVSNEVCREYGANKHTSEVVYRPKTVVINHNKKGNDPFPSPGYSGVRRA